MKKFLLLLLMVVSTLSYGQSKHIIDADTLCIQDGTCVDKTELGNVDGTSSNIQTQLNGKQSTLTNSAGLAGALSDETGTGAAVFAGSPALTGVPTVPTASQGNNSTQAASTSYVDTGLATKQGTLTNSAGLAAALSDETGTGANVMAVSPALTGTPTVPTAALDTNTTQAASTAYVKTQIAGDSTVVHTTGNESVAGTKTYTGKTVAISTTNGFHPCPTMTQTQRDAIASPADGDCINNSTTNALNTYNSATSLWQAVGTGSGSGGGADYITNDDAETNTSGWSCYADAAAATPVDGTGGSPTTAIATSSSSPLSGAQSFVITKSTTQGEGCSYAFTIDAAYKAKTLRIMLPYETTSLVDGSFRVYIYDVTNSRLIDVDNRDINANTFGQFIGSFQTSSDSVSYRLILHGADTTAGALKFDKGEPVTLGPQTLVKGPVVTDWKTFTPTVTNVSTSSVTGSYRRVGDTAFIHVKAVYSGVPTGSVIVNISGVGTIDTAKVTSPFTGVATYLDDSTSTGYVGSPFVSTSTTIRFYSSHVAGEWDANAPIASPASPDWIEFDIQVPIAGWASTQTLSEDAGNRQIALRAVRSSNQSVATVSATQIAYNTASVDTCGMLNTTTGDITICESGWYFISMQTMPQALAASDNYVSRIRKAGTTELAIENVPTLVTDNNQTHTINTLQYLTKGEVISGWTDSGVDSAYTITGTTAPDSTWISVFKIQSPQTLAGGETVAVSALQSSGTSLPNTGSTDISWDSTKSFETHTGSLSGTTFTAPASGKYKSCTRLKLSSASWTSGNSFSMSLFKNGSVAKYLEDSQIAATASIELNMSGCTDLQLSKGDTLKINVSHNRTGGAVTISSSTTQNYWDIVRVGN
jgi:hypothetical protein